MNGKNLIQFNIQLVLPHGMLDWKGECEYQMNKTLSLSSGDLESKNYNTES